MKSINVEKSLDGNSIMEYNSIRCVDFSSTFNKKTILNNINFIAPSNEVITVVGNSKSGKTTLLKALSGIFDKNVQYTGSILYNELPLSKKKIRNLTSFLPIHVPLLECLTVYETLFYQVKFNFGYLPYEKQEQKVKNIISLLNLDLCKNTIVGDSNERGISLGERKRLCIGLELLRNRPFFILDEITTGLDSALSIKLYNVLENIARTGKIVIISMHQPISSLWSLLNKVVILSSGGVAFYGFAKELYAYLRSIRFNISVSETVLESFLSDIRRTEMIKKKNKSNIRNNTQPLTIHNGEVSNSNINGNEIEYFENPVGSTHIEQYSFSEVAHNDQNNYYNDQNNYYNDQNNYYNDQNNYYNSKLSEIYPTNNQSNYVTQHNNNLSVPDYPAIYYDSSYRQEFSDYVNAANPYNRSLSLLSKKYRTPNCFIRLYIHERRKHLFWLCVLIAQMIQGILLGGYFFKIDSHVSYQDPSNLNFSSLYTIPVIDILKSGLEGGGEQPLLYFIAYALESKDYKTVLEAVKRNPASFELIESVFLCVTDVLKLDSYIQSFLSAEELEKYKKDKEYMLTRQMNLLMEFYKFIHSMLELGSHHLSTVTPKSPLTYSKINIYKVMTKCLMFRHLNIDLSKYNWDALRTKWQLSRRNMSLSDDLNIEGFDFNFFNVTSDAGPLQIKKSFFDKDTKIDMPANTKLQSAFNYWFNILKDLSVFNQIKTQFGMFFHSYVDVYFVLLTTAGSLIFITAVLGFALFLGFLSIYQDLALLKLDLSNRLYSVSIYFLARNLVDIIFQILFCFFLSTIFYFMVNTKLDLYNFLIYTIACYGIVFSAYGFGYLIASIIHNLNVALIVSILTSTILLALSGFILVEKDIPLWVQYLSDVSFYKWGFFTLMTNRFPDSYGFLGGYSNAFIRKYFQIQSITVAHSMFALYFVGFVFRLFSHLALQFSPSMKTII